MLELSSMLNLSVGDHLCCMYMTEEEHRNILAPFIRCLGKDDRMGEQGRWTS